VVKSLQPQPFPQYKTNHSLHCVKFFNIEIMRDFDELHSSIARLAPALLKRRTKRGKWNFPDSEPKTI
jgi:hypothetical protein